MIPLDLPPRLILPEKPAIVRANTLSAPAILRDLKFPILAMPLHAGYRIKTPKNFLLKEILDTVSNTNLRLCLDASDSASQSLSTNQQWNDVSGNGHHFNRGTTSASNSTDPTFNGTVGALGAYYSFDGGDYFTAVSSTTFANAYSQDNAVFTIIAQIFFTSGSSGSQQRITGNSTASSGSRGISFQKNGTTNLIEYNCKTASAGWTSFLGTAATLNAWNVCIVSVNEAGGANASHFNINGTITAFNANVASNAGTANLAIGNAPDASGSAVLLNGSRLSCLGIVDRALSQSETARIAAYMAKRF
ncbi:hypothetical protein IZ6_24940 [Terrihabitans soli]|uniref:LamG domain-containing protein n=1 Tax=Terrihabitans soli TaxID=708113 RepID=A0A6S6QRS7_9HYPH|nr:hypothetical protein [Terrihabitans soli]BCJ91759.1 hypothetical protein IZ6_24940 [Terrihabitans soli]